jgi:hypothetical protein
MRRAVLLSRPPRFRRGSSEIIYLQNNLSGGAASMAFLYSTLGTVNVTGSVVDSVVDRLGLGPNVVASSTARPTWDAVNKLITGDGINDRLAPSANHAVFDFSTLNTIVTVAVFNDADGIVPASIAESLAFARWMSPQNGASNIVGGWKGGVGMADSGVAKGTSLRVVVHSHNDSTTGTITVISHASVTHAITSRAGGTGTNRLTILDDFPATGHNATGPWRATLGLTNEPTAGDLVVLGTWGVNHHGATLAA